MVVTANVASMKLWKCVVVLLLMVLVQISESLATIQVTYVIPNANSSDCPKGEHCTTLQQCIDRRECFKNNTMLVLLKGTHNMTLKYPNEYKGTTEHLQNFTMRGNTSRHSDLNYPPKPDVIVLCKGAGGFQFKFSIGLRFENLAFESCGTQVTKQLQLVHGTLAFYIVTDVVIESIRINNSAGFGIHAKNVYGEVNISNSIFSFNKGNENTYGGNAHFWYRECASNKSNTHITIKNSWFLNGSDSCQEKSSDRPNATGLTVMVDCSFIHVTVENITAEFNRASKGGNLAMAFVDQHNNTASISINDSRIGHGNADRGGGLTVWSEIKPSTESISCGYDLEKKVILVIDNTEFYDNFAKVGGGALYLSHYERRNVDCIIRKIKFRNCKFTHNVVHHSGSGAAAQITKYEMLGEYPHPEPQFEVSFKNTSFSKHQFVGSKPGNVFAQHGIINALSVGKLVLHNTNFTDNNSTAISLLSSNMVLRGHVIFENNVGFNGGALELCTSSVIIIENSTRTHIEFINNHAHKAGGAIYAEEPCLDAVPTCFFQPELNLTSALLGDCRLLNLSMRLTFIDNTACDAGDAIYNGAIEACYMQYNHRVHLESSVETWSSCIFNEIFDVSQQKALNNESYISSEPQRVCLCPNYKTKDCSVQNFKYNRTVFPGEPFNISVVAVGQMNGTVPAVVEASLSGNDSRDHILSGTTVGKSGQSCQNMTLAVGSNSSSSVFFCLSVQPPRWKYEVFPQVEVQIEKCPHGFSRNNSSKICTCDENLSAKWKLLCNDETFKYKRLEPMWIGDKDNVYLFSNCNHDYCNLQLLNQEDSLMVEDYKQCNFNRTGLICGACINNYSVVLGSSRCLQCSNNRLGPLLAAFAAAGIALFAFLFLFNFTVTEGTINGLIFYANIVHLNPDAFIRGNIIHPLSVLIAWFNLDLGIETCFFDGMDDYTKLWLQFAFVAYIWILGGTIIFLSRKYVIVTRFFGPNVTKVLATLFLLTFTKVGRTITKILSFSFIRGSTLSLWHVVSGFDGNIIYLSPKHVPLFVLGCSVALVFTFFGTTLMLIQFLQRGSTFKPLQWVERFRPFFEAFTGPCKDNYRFWPGLLFMCRGSLIVVSLLYQDPLNSLIRVTVIAAMSMFLLCLSCVTPKGVYKQWPLNVLECSFFLNLTVTSIGLLVLEAIKKKVIPFSDLDQHQYISSISISIAVLTFIGILTFHACVQLTSSRFLKRCIKRVTRRILHKLLTLPEPTSESLIINSRRANTEPPTLSIVTVEESTEDESTRLLSQYMPPVVGYNQYREPLLADD